MIKTRDLVPGIYYNKSRDFQALGRVFEVLYNYAKTGADLVANSYEDTKMLDLLVTTLGFNSKHNYNVDDLVALCNTFIIILKNKGSIKSVEDAITALMNAQHLESAFAVIDRYEKEPGTETTIKMYSIDIYIPEELTDLILLEDLFEYILPAGYTYRFIYSTFVSEPLKTNLDFSSVEDYIKYDTNSNLLSQVGVVTAVEDGNAVNINRPTIGTLDNTPMGISYASVVFRPTLRN